MPRDDDFPSAARFAVAASAGLLLALACVWAGEWWHYGPGRAAALRGAFLRGLAWSLPLAALAGALHRPFYRSVAERRLRGKPNPGAILLGVPRAFAHFMLFGMIALLAFLFALARAIARAVWFKLRPPAVPREPDDALAAMRVPIWFVTLPFTVSGEESEGELELPVTVPRARLLKWLPFLCACVILYTDAYSEDTGKRVDLFYLVAGAAYWLGDYLIAALVLMPYLRGKRGLAA